MRKKFFNGKRVMALALALSLVVSDAAFAQVANTNPEATMETAEEAAESETYAEEAVANETAETEAVAEETVSENAAETETVTEDQNEEVAEEEDALETKDETEDTDAKDDELEADEAYNGSLSVPVGLDCSLYQNNSYYDNNGNYAFMAQTTFEYPATVYVKGKLTEANGFYSYGGKTYISASYDSDTDFTKLYASNEVQILPGTGTGAYYNEANGLYNVNGALYTLGALGTKNSKVYFKVNYPKATVVTTTPYDQGTANVYKTYGRYTNNHGVTNAAELYEDYSPNYYVVNGVCYKYLSSNYVNGNNVWYVEQDDVMSPTTYSVVASWNELDNPNIELDAYDAKSIVVYEVKVNGVNYTKNLDPMVDAKGNVHYVSSSNAVEISRAGVAGQSFKVQVRGLYAHWVNVPYTDANGQPSSREYRIIDAEGPWSDEFNYTVATKTAVPAVSSLSVTKKNGLNDTLKIKWAAIPSASYYYYYLIYIKKPAPITAANFKDYFYDNNNIWTTSGFNYSEFATRGGYSSSVAEKETDYSDEGYTNVYVAVVPMGVSDSDKHYNFVSDLSDITSVASTALPVNTAKTPAITGFKAEKQSDGTIDLRWDKIDASVVIYAVDTKTPPALFKYYNFNSDYNGSSVKREIKDAAGNVIRTVSLSNEISSGYSDINGNWVTNVSKDIYKYKKIKVKKVSGKNGVFENVISNFSLTPGKTYYFMACTYDPDEPWGSVAKASPLTYTYASRTTSDAGTLVKGTTTVQYTYYPTLGQQTGMVSVKQKFKEPDVDTLGAKKSIKLTMSNYSYLGTGYEIYRKSGKKYKKVATTTNSTYVDEGLKEGTTYSYKVRSYYYDPDSKQTIYSDYKVFTAKTFAAEMLRLHVAKKTKTSVKLKWTKVSTASKYEIYRTDDRNADYTVASKKFTASGVSKSYLSSQGYKLVKSINGSKTTSFTDKKLTAGETYRYMVVAYYRQGNVVEMQSADDSITLKLETPRVLGAVVKGKKVVVTWDADKYAAGYEIRYYVRNKYHHASSSEPVIKTTKKATYTISGIETGGDVSEIQVRAYTKKKEYSDWSDDITTADLTLPPVKGITAKEVTTKNGTSGVKISWKAVSGAKYYKVYRSTSMGTYDADAKTYYAISDGCSTIKKSGNDNYIKSDELSSLSKGYRFNATSSYAEYEGIADSVVGTSAYDYEDLPAGVTYYYTVVAFGESEGGNSGSEISSVEVVKPAMVTVKTGTNFTATSKKGKVTIKCNKLTGASVKYTIYRSNKAKGKFTKIGTSKKPTFTDKKSKKGKTYYYKVEVSGTNALKADFTATSAAKKVKAK